MVRGRVSKLLWSNYKSNPNAELTLYPKLALTLTTYDHVFRSYIRCLNSIFTEIIAFIPSQIKCTLIVGDPVNSVSGELFLHLVKYIGNIRLLKRFLGMRGDLFR